MRANSAVTTHFVGNILVESCKYADCFTTTPIPIQIPTTATTTSAPTNTVPAPTTPTFTSSGTSATTTSLLATISSHILSSTNSLTTTLTTFNYAINNSNTIPTTTATGETAVPNVPAYIRNTAMLLCITIMVLGIVGNVMVPIVIIKTKDMRNSTNIFLTNLSIADLLVLLICTPTVLVEVNTRPETWILGHELCKAVPFIELTVAHASVLTILAISFERYYAICEPLKAGYVCTKARAMLICMLAWGIAALFTSPILWVAEYKYIEYVDGSSVAVCLTQALTGWTVAYFLTSISIFFILPLILLIILYGIIAKHLISNKGTMMLRIRPAKPELSQKARKQVVFMLGTVVLSFFLCLLPFRLLTLWIILSSDHTMLSMGMDRYYSFLYFCRLMLYLNSAINPVLYNLMSTKFRKGFLQLIKSLTCTCGSCCHNSNQRISLNNMSANNIVTNTSSSILTRSSHRRISEDTHVKKSSSEEAEITAASLVGKSCSINEIVIQLKGIKRLKSLQQQETTIVMLESETQVLNDSPIVESEVEMDIDMDMGVDVDVDMDMAVHEMLQLNENKNNCESKHLTFCLPSILESTQI